MKNNKKKLTPLSPGPHPNRGLQWDITQELNLYRQFVLSLIFHDCEVLSLLNLPGQSKRNNAEDQPNFSQTPWANLSSFCVMHNTFLLFRLMLLSFTLLLISCHYLFQPRFKILQLIDDISCIEATATHLILSEILTAQYFLIFTFSFTNFFWVFYFQNLELGSQKLGPTLLAL